MWIKCSDRLPTEYGSYLVFIWKCSSLGSSKYIWCNHFWERVDGEPGGNWVNVHEDEMITHWMPLPTPPNPEAKEENSNIAQQLKAEICEWNTKDFGEWSGYATSCGERVQSIMPLDGMRYCPYCSRKLSAV